MKAAKLPTDLNVYLTNKCNFKCKHCLRQVKPKQVVADVSIELLEKVLELYPIKTVCIAGFGEPLMSDKLFPIIKFLNSREMAPGLITNGSLVTSCIEQFSQVNLLYVSISLNVVTAKEHEDITGTKMFDIVLDGIRRLKALNNFPIGVSKILFKSEINSLPAFITLATQLNVDFANITNSLPYSKEAEVEIVTENDTAVIGKLDWLKQMKDTKVVNKWPIIVKNECPHSCSSPWVSIGINGTGEISGCRRVHPPSSDFGAFGPIRFWEEGEEMTALRDGVKGKGMYASVCRKCFGNYKGT